MKKYNINKLEMGQINKEQLSENILDRIKGNEEFTDTDLMIGEKIYRVGMLEEILTEDDDTSAETKLEIKELFDQFDDECSYFMVTNI